MIIINYKTHPVRLENQNTSKNFCFEMPERCPRCHVSGYFNPRIAIASLKRFDPRTEVDIIGLPLSCPSCGDIFISVYAATDVYSSTYNSYKTTYLYSGPSTFQGKAFPSEIRELSPTFCKLYNEAESAEHYNLESLAGMGYRNALEHLIKDFAIHKHPDLKEAVEKSPLSQCINNYVDNNNLVATALRCAWLGNDCAHYLKKFSDYDLKDLKAFLAATTYWVSAELITEKSLQLAPR